MHGDISTSTRKWPYRSLGDCRPSRWTRKSTSAARWRSRKPSRSGRATFSHAFLSGYLARAALDHGARVIRGRRQARPCLRRGCSDAQALQLGHAWFHVGKKAAVAEAVGKGDGQHLRANQEFDVVTVPAGAQAHLVEVVREVHAGRVERFQQAEEIGQAAGKPRARGERARRALERGETGLGVVNHGKREVASSRPSRARGRAAGRNEGVNR